MADWDFILAPTTIKVRFKIDEVGMLTHSLRLLNLAKTMSGFGAWIYETAEKLTPEQLLMNSISSDAMDCAVKAKNFPDLIQMLGEKAPRDIVEPMISWVRQKESYPGTDAELLATEDNFIAVMRDILEKKYEDKGFEFNEVEFRAKYYYLTHPDEMKSKVVAHLKFMWDNHLRSEWKHVKPMLEASLESFADTDYSNMGGFEIIEAVTGRNMRSSDYLVEHMPKVEQITFVPSAHVGPYLGFNPAMETGDLAIFFGARQPKDAKIKSAELNRSELLVRLNALADETRLKMLELLTQYEELCAQDFITLLDLSQSSASRHLRQLTASGYVSERRRDVAKCYTINPERIDDTIRALKDFLRKD